MHQSHVRETMMQCLLRILFIEKYLNDWENSVKERTGFSKTEKATMVMSQPTREGLKMACMLG